MAHMSLDLCVAFDNKMTLCQIRSRGKQDKCQSQVLNQRIIGLVWFGLVEFYGISTIVAYAPPLGLSSLAKEFTIATRIMQSSSNELSTLVSGKV